MRRPTATLLLLTGLLAGLSGCSSNPYTITFGNNVVYSPSAALRNKIVSDPSLQGCINQVLESMEEPDPAEISILACPDAGILSLDGIGALEGLEQLELSSNGIDNLSPLLPLRNLRMVSLRNNRLSNIGPLESLPVLRFVALEGNQDIPCRQLDALGKRLGNTLSRPASCVR